MKSNFSRFNRLSIKVFFAIMCALVVTMFLTVIIVGIKHKNINSDSLFEQFAEDTTQEIAAYYQRFSEDNHSENAVSQNTENKDPSADNNAERNALISRATDTEERLIAMMRQFHLYPRTALIIKNQKNEWIVTKNLRKSWIDEKNSEGEIVGSVVKHYPARDYHNEGPKPSDEADTSAKKQQSAGRNDFRLDQSKVVLKNLVLDDQTFNLFFYKIKRNHADNSSGQNSADLKHNDKHKEERPGKRTFMKHIVDEFIIPAGFTFMLIFALIAFVFSYLLSRYITRPIHQINQVSHSIAGGNLYERVREKKLLARRDELGFMAKNFNSMAEDVQKLFERQQNILRDISHELRSPLARMNLTVELLRDELEEDTKLSAGSSDMLKRLNKESQRMDRLIQEIVDYSEYNAELQTKENILPLQACSVNRLIERAAEDARFEYQNENKKIALELMPKLSVDGNEQALYKVFDNVIRNAMFYTRNNTTVVVKALRVQDGVRVNVIDQGPGVPESEIKSIFLPLYRVSSARDRDSGGFGLGLSIASKICQYHGGNISARNNAPEDSAEVKSTAGKISGAQSHSENVVPNGLNVEIYLPFNQEKTDD